MTAVAASPGVPVETLRKIESGWVPTPTFFTTAAIAAEVGLPLDVLVRTCTTARDDSQHLTRDAAL